MASESKGLGDFLQGLKGHQVPRTAAELDGQYPGGLRLVVGNESADLDSIASAVAYAWHLQGGGGATATVPVVGVPRADWQLRPETDHLFTQRLGVSVEHVWFADDVERLLPAEEQGGRLQVVLVDHNQLCQEMSERLSAGAVVEILDHHVDEGRYADTVAAQRRRIAVVGSCATLVAEQLTPEALALPGGEQLRTLLIAPILVDTANFDPAAATGTQRDRDALAALSDGLYSAEQIDELFAALRDKKCNIDCFTNEQLLRKDYKNWTLAGSAPIACGISSAPMSLQRLAATARGDFVADLAAFRQQCQLDLLVVLTNFRDDADRFHRQLLLCADAPLLARVADFLATATDLNIAPIDLPAASSPSILAFEQHNLKASRKQVQPALVRFAAAL